MNMHNGTDKASFVLYVCGPIESMICFMFLLQEFLCPSNLSSNHKALRHFEFVKDKDFQHA